MTETNLDSDFTLDLPTTLYLTFTVGSEDFAVEVASIKEIRAWSRPTPIPNAPDSVHGMINLRGMVVPVVDVRARFGYCRTEAGPMHVLVVVAIGHRTVALLVDAVADIVSLAAEDIRPVFAAEHPDSGLAGLTSIDGSPVALIDLASIVCFDDPAEAEQTAGHG